jgi:cellulose biosynthesis protein BcsQ
LKSEKNQSDATSRYQHSYAASDSTNQSNPAASLKDAIALEHSSMEYQTLHKRISELLNEIENIKALNRKKQLWRDGNTRNRVESRRIRLNEIKQELRQLAAKKTV